MSQVSLIVARARNSVIGHQGRMPWHLPEDLAHFKRTTLGKPIIMGRKTWESIGRPLPGRRNIVVTRNPAYLAPGAELATSLAAAYARVAAEPEVFVIGGGELYAQAMANASRLYLTEIAADFDGDAHFPTPDPAHWHETAREHHASTASRPWSFDFITYERAPDAA
ncbi:MAG: dihydrofolate reductase [Burkholderiaceae bacterium]